MDDLTSIVLASVGILFIGLAKAGFGGGLGMLTTPLCVLAFSVQGKPPTFAIGVLLPLLIIGDALSMRHYWGAWDKRNLKLVLPGVIVGIIIGIQLIDRFSPRQLNIVIGALAVCFVVFQLIKHWIFKAEEGLKPGHALGVPFGLAAGVTSTFAHGAGPVITMYLVPQKLPKKLFMGTNVLIFTWINWLKMPFFIGKGMITGESLLMGLKFVLLIPIGVWIGVWLNKRVSEFWFSRLVYLFTFLAGLQLILNVNIGQLFR